MPENYAFILNTMFLTAFYSPLLPIGLVYSMLGLMMHYWVQKYILINRRKVTTALGSSLSNSMTGILELFLPIFCIGNLLFVTMIAYPKAEKNI
jgi:hypothetical protein